MRKSEDSVV